MSGNSVTTRWRVISLLAGMVAVGLIVASTVVHVAYQAPWPVWLPLELVGFVLIGVGVSRRKKTTRGEHTESLAKPS
ncbi:hypothetical protein [Nocardia wallacei]|uniref:hypothetical protein n=1 Tax=Nocardia wallacei TaxID=480035 RepID=UPI0024556B6D|nr:hypothetical protein [Nocardia wallacei]